MSFSVFLSKLDAGELGKHAVADIALILSLIRFHIRKNAKLHELRIRQIIETEKVCTSLLKSRAVFAESIRRCRRQELARAMTEAFVKVCMEVTCDVTVFLFCSNLLFRPCKLAEHAFRCFLSRLAVCRCKVGYSHGLRPVLATDPVCVRKVDAYRSGRIAVSGKSGHIDDFCCNSLHLRLLETLVYRGVILKPLCVVAYEFSPA